MLVMVPIPYSGGGGEDSGSGADGRGDDGGDDRGSCGSGGNRVSSPSMLSSAMDGSSTIGHIFSPMASLTSRCSYCIGHSRNNNDDTNPLIMLVMVPIPCGGGGGEDGGNGADGHGGRGDDGGNGHGGCGSGGNRVSSLSMLSSAMDSSSTIGHIFSPMASLTSRGGGGEDGGNGADGHGGRGDDGGNGHGGCGSGGNRVSSPSMLSSVMDGSSTIGHIFSPMACLTS
ncbi:uncharacterized protein LOC112341394 [Selaginella moellendorffii]|uniref:uncharacterized protein LOC112341394 n=1 Tax=Selaginella moellendorffii TaxID=88036 RepID=UPI000D1CC9CF|nr:uncharacterized protein LOC112341394 [Selaginella moellendorffii]|eukprot:XP_024517169.1 uncharacterized protein LOC112341394 [Selaginella moellendorffii]